MTGFGAHFETEAIEGALPKGRNSPQRPAFGLYAEQLSGSSFTSPRHENRRSWLYRMRPTADHRPFARYDGAPLFSALLSNEPLAPNRLRWDPPQDLPEGFDGSEDTWYFPRVCGTFKERAGWHGCQMPEQLLGRIIRACSNPGDLVLDFFAHSGSTLLPQPAIDQAA